jgi:hypothetical protein
MAVTPPATPVVPAKNSWLVLNPKVKALAIAVAILVLSSVGGSLTGNVSWHDTAIADVPAVLGLVIAYLKSST